MVERRPWLDILAHVILLCGVAMVAFPLYVTFVASTQTAQEVASAPMSLLLASTSSTTTCRRCSAARPAAPPARRWAA